MRLEAPKAWAHRGWISAALVPAALLFGAAVALRRTAYRRGWAASCSAGAPVIVIGNISVGGTGKTPMVGWLAQRLLRGGYSPAVVSRGYGGRKQRAPVRVARDSDPAEVGDEPVMLAQQAGCPVWVCIDRASAARRAVQEGADVVVSDDGLQHYRMTRDLEFCVLDGTRGLGNGRLLPAGPMRETPKRLNEIDLLLIRRPLAGATLGTGGARVAAAAREAGEASAAGVALGVAAASAVRAAAPRLASEFQGIEFALRIEHAQRLDGAEKRDLKDFAGQRILALAGIGAPERYYAALESAGLAVEPVPAADHGRVDLNRLLARRLPVLMTAKDAVKYRGLNSNRLWWTPASVAMSESAAEQLMRPVLKLLGESK